MYLRLPKELGRQLEELAVAEYSSKPALLVQGAELLLQRRGRSRDMVAGFELVVSHDAELRQRLDVWASSRGRRGSGEGLNRG